MSNPPVIYVAVVDDDESFCRSFARLLRASGIQAVTYSSAEAFLEDGKQPKFDCLVLDIELGGISGLELYRRLTLVGQQVPAVFVTARDDEESRAEARDLGCKAFFGKTALGVEILTAIRQATQVPKSNPTTPTE